MNYGNIVNAMSMIFDTTRGVLYRPLDKRIRDIFYVTKGMDLSRARGYKMVVNEVNVVLVEAMYEGSLNLFNTTFYDIVYLDSDISIVIFVNPIIDSMEHVSDTFHIIKDIVHTLTSIIKSRMGMNNYMDFPRASIYTTLLTKVNIVLAIKSMQRIMVDFSQNDITEFLAAESRNQMYGKFDRFIKKCFSESIEDLLEAGLLYEYITILHRSSDI